MPKRPELLFLEKMTRKERVKFTLACVFFLVVLTGSFVFFSKVCGTTIIGIFTGADAVYYSARDVFVFLYVPAMGYFDVLVFLFLFLPFTYHLVKLWVKMQYVVYGYMYLAFVVAFLLSIYIPLFPLSDYYSCGLKGPFSGVHYVKDQKMCEQFEYHPEEDAKSENISTSVKSSDEKIK